jgi:hypothetical protein
MATTTNMGMAIPALPNRITDDIPAIGANFQAIDAEFGLSGPTANRPTSGLYVGRRYFDTTLGQVVWWDGLRWIGPTGSPNVAFSRVSDMLITSTSATTVASLTPIIQGNFEVKVYYRVVTAATNLNITLTYTDGSGTQQTYNFVNGGLQPVGPQSCVPVLINATPTSPIVVSATAGTANQVYVSCTIRPE